MRNTILGISVLVAVIALLGCVLYSLENSENYYYSKIDNSKVEELSATDNMKYKYTLACYDENGKKKKISFKTSRILKEDAYLKLRVIPISGVNKWEEVEYNNLPKKVQEKYKTD